MDTKHGSEIDGSTVSTACLLTISGLRSAMSSHRSAGELLEILHKLRDYTSTHFRDEEKHFVRTDYPSVKDHLKIHREFEAKVDEVESGIKAGTVTLSMDLLSFLKDWLVKTWAWTRSMCPMSRARPRHCPRSRTR